MDRIDAMKVFVAALNEGSLAGAGRKLGKSPAAVSRAIAFLEAHVGADLLHRTTRSIKLSEAGERYAASCRRILIDLDLYPAVSVRLHLLDRPANLIDEGIDVALRLAHLADSSLVAIRVGEVRRVVAAAPRYLAQHPRIVEPSDLAMHQVIAMTHFGLDSWTFPPVAGSTIPRSIPLTPRFVVNSIRAAVASAVEGRGVTRMFSYHVARELSAGQLEIVLGGDEHPPLPVHLVSPQGRLSVPKVRAFVDFAVPRLRPAFAQWADSAAA